MSTSPDSEQTTYYVEPEQLRIGMYVFVDLPWYKHPFTLSSFKIASTQQIKELKALGQTRFRFDPDRSETVNDPPQQGTPSPPARTTPDPPAATGEAPPPPPPAPLDLVMAEKNERIQRLADQRKSVAAIEKSFMKASGVMRGLNKGLYSRPTETMEELGGMVDQMVSVFLENPEVTLQVLSGNAGGEEIYYHGLNVSILCLMLAKELHVPPQHARLLGTGALLHDIGLTEIPDRVLRKSPSEYTKPERELRAMHVAYGLKLGQRLGLAPEVLDIIGQHHELADGTGYPNAVKLDQISPLARIVSLVNFYDNLCNPLDATHAMTPHEALSFMYAQRRAKFDPVVLQVLVRSLGVYPPGSIVKLSNDAIAMVVSVNPKKALRPWVLVHDPDIPKEEAIMLNLEMETSLSIRQAIRPGLLEPAVFSYLCPRKRVTYFFDGASAHENQQG